MAEDLMQSGIEAHRFGPTNVRETTFGPAMCLFLCAAYDHQWCIGMVKNTDYDNDLLV